MSVAQASGLSIKKTFLWHRSQRFHIVAKFTGRVSLTTVRLQSDSKLDFSAKTGACGRVAAPGDVIKGDKISPRLMTSACVSSSRVPQLLLPCPFKDMEPIHQFQQEGKLTCTRSEMKNDNQKVETVGTCELFDDFQQEDLKLWRVNNSVWARWSVFGS